MSAFVECPDEISAPRFPMRPFVARDEVCMGNVTPIRHAMPISAEVSKALEALDRAIIKAIADAQAAGLPQGFVVAITHSHALRETQRMNE